MLYVTLKDLEKIVDRINETAGIPKEAWNGNHANIGCYYLLGAHGGYQLHQIFNDAGGCTTPLSTGYISEPRLYDVLTAFLYGIAAGKKL